MAYRGRCKDCSHHTDLVAAWAHSLPGLVLEHDAVSAVENSDSPHLTRLASRSSAGGSADRGVLPLDRAWLRGAEFWFLHAAVRDRWTLARGLDKFPSTWMASCLPMQGDCILQGGPVCVRFIQVPFAGMRAP